MIYFETCSFCQAKIRGWFVFIGDMSGLIGRLETNLTHVRNTLLGRKHYFFTMTTKTFN